MKEFAVFSNSFLNASDKKGCLGIFQSSPLYCYILTYGSNIRCISLAQL